MTPNKSQSEAWNGPESAHYVDHADRYDRQLQPIADALFDRVRLGPDDSVLDIGCGSGATTLTAARSARYALGADISAPLIEVAARRAEEAGIDNAEFVVADAQTHPFAEEGFDFVISQFGLMFFDDAVGAFANLGRSLVPGGTLAFTCWQGLEANEWVQLIADAVARHVELPSLGGQAGGPGMFALKVSEETRSLLDAAGFTQVEIEPVSRPILVGGGGTEEESAEFLLGTGIARGLLGQVDPGVRPGLVEEIRSSLSAHYEPGVGLRLGSGTWLVSARR